MTQEIRTHNFLEKATTKNLIFVVIAFNLLIENGSVVIVSNYYISQESISGSPELSSVPRQSIRLWYKMSEIPSHLDMFYMYLVTFLDIQTHIDCIKGDLGTKTDLDTKYCIRISLFKI